MKNNFTVQLRAMRHLASICLVVLSLTSLGGSQLHAEDHPVVYLWPEGAPGSEGKTDKELIQTSANGEQSVSRIHKPSITVYLPSKEKATGAAVLVIPGGGHRVLAITHEGYNVAQWLSDHGIAAFVLKNRLARETNSTYKIEVEALQDTQRALRVIRSRDGEWGVNPDHLGVMGFSAGGELAALASMKYDNGMEGATDSINIQKSKPAFQALIYPGNSGMVKPDKDSPPAFLACGFKDRPDISEGLPNVYLLFKKAGVPADLHIYAGAGHGFGYRESNHSPSNDWLLRFQEFLGDRGMLKN